MFEPKLLEEGFSRFWGNSLVKLGVGPRRSSTGWIFFLPPLLATDRSGMSETNGGSSCLNCIKNILRHILNVQRVLPHHGSRESDIKIRFCCEFHELDGRFLLVGSVFHFEANQVKQSQSSEGWDDSGSMWEQGERKRSGTNVEPESN